ncbi:flavin-containing amine oxidoreductase-domain containing protein [Catenaria anguillulae PL171]|uniref:Flavin-containing amine oxidoreductase-domain containing protein n=1 Tax=Catenaria anguillulae PL171 TaxID=765915 RepID=A0A1Y2HM31_9FUNG|nr:flavin-containing amine oxidoreductase-domain containing protein [Catenaria anguillulae PL171]
MDSKNRPPRRQGGTSGFGNQNARRTTKGRDSSQTSSQASSSVASSPNLRDDNDEQVDHDEDAMDIDTVPQPNRTKSSSSSVAVRTPSLSPPADAAGNGDGTSSKTLSAASALAASLTPAAKALLDGFSKLASPKPCSSPRILPNCDPLPTSAASTLGAFTSESTAFTSGVSSNSSLTGGLDEVELDLATLPSDSLVHAAIEARLPITAMSDLEFHTFGKHFGSPADKLATYLDARNRILRAFFLSPQRALTLHEAIRACRDHRLDLVGALYQFLVRNSMVNFGVVRPPGITGGVLVTPAAMSPVAQAPAESRASTPPTLPLSRPRRFVVIGAGAAGLACARQLKQISESIAYSATLDPASQTAHVARTIPPPEVIVLEARNRVGGRVYTHPLYTKVRTSQSPFASTYTTGVDLGAKVVTGFDGGNPIKTIVRGQLRLKTHELNGSTRMFDSQGDEVDSGLDETIEEVFNEVLEETTRMREEMKAATKKAARSRGRAKSGRSMQTPVSGTGRQTRRMSITTRSAAALGMSSSGAESSAASSRASSVRRSTRRAVATASLDSSSLNTSDQDSSANLAPSDVSDVDSVSHQSSGSDDEDDARSTRSRNSSSSNKAAPRLFSPLPKLSTMSLGDAIEKALNSHPQYQSFSDKETELLHWHLANLEFANSSTVDQNSLEHWDQDDEHELLGPHGMIIGGYGQVTHALAYGCRAMAVQAGADADGIATDALDLRLNTPVTQIRWNKVHKSRLRSSSLTLAESSAEPSNVEVTCADGTRIVADAVVITAPLGVLKSGSIKFSPDLPKQKQTSIQRLGFGTLNKVVLVFKSAFWDTSVESFGYANPPDPTNPLEYSTTRGRNYLFWNMTDVVKLPVLVAMSAGHAAVRLESTPDTIIVQEALDALRKIYGPRNVPAPLETVVTRWSYDEYARGSYSYVATGSSGEDYDRLAAPLGNTVYFAGEHTCREYPATVHGAMLSGMRAAAEVANAVFGEVRYVEDDAVMEVVEAAPELSSVAGNGNHGGGELAGMSSGIAGGVVNSLFATLVNGMAGASGGTGTSDEPMQVDVFAAPATKRKRGGIGHVASAGASSSGSLPDQATAVSTTDVDSMEDVDSGDGGANDQPKRLAKKAKPNAPGSTHTTFVASKPTGAPATQTTSAAVTEDPAVWRILPGRNWSRTNVTIPCTQYLSTTAPCTVTCSTPTEFFEHILTHLTPSDRLRFPGEPDERGEYPTLPRMYMPIPPKPPTKNPFMLFQLVSWEAMRRETPGNERHLIRQRMGERWRDLDLVTKQVFQAEVDRMQEKYAKAMDVFRMQCEALGLGEYRTHLEAQVPVDLEKLEESLSQVGTPVLQAATLFISARMLASADGQSSPASAAAAGRDSLGDDGGGLTSPSPLARMTGTPPLKPGENPHARRDGLLAAGAAGVIPMPSFPSLPPMARSSSPRPGSRHSRTPQRRTASPSGGSERHQHQQPRPPGIHTPGRPVQPRSASPKQPPVIPPIQPSRSASASSPKLPGPRALFPSYPSTPSSSVPGAVSHHALSSPHSPSASLLGSPSAGMPPSFALYQASSRLNRFESAGTSPPPPPTGLSSTHAPPPGVIAPGTIPTTSASHHNTIKSPPDGIKTYLNTVAGDRQYQQYVQQRSAAAHGSPSSAASGRSGSAGSDARSPAPSRTRALPPPGNR